MTGLFFGVQAGWTQNAVGLINGELNWSSGAFESSLVLPLQYTTLEGTPAPH